MKTRPLNLRDWQVQALQRGALKDVWVPVRPQPGWIENSGRWWWPIPKHVKHPGPCTTVVSASREWWEYLPPGCCHLGAIGDQLWTRECYTIESSYGLGDDYKPPHADGRPTAYSHPSPDQDWETYWEQPHYRATDPTPELCYEDQKSTEPHVRWSSSQTMPRWASRWLLEVTSVNVRRVDTITIEEAYRAGLRAPVAPTDDPKVGKLLIPITGECPQAYWPCRYYPEGKGDDLNEEDVMRALFASEWDQQNHKKDFPFKDRSWAWKVGVRISRGNFPEIKNGS